MQTMDYIPNRREKVEGTVALIEATHNENHNLWLHYSKQGARCAPAMKEYGTVPKLDWIQVNPGHWEQIGTLDKRPVCVSVFWARIDGYLVGFWDATSQVVDYEMVKVWLKKTFPDDVYMTDATNFYNAIHHIREREKNDSPLG